ncbi:MAG: calcium-binding protein [Methylococcaceae bacterium]
MAIARFLQPIDIRKISVSYNIPKEITATKLEIGFFDGTSFTSLTTFYGNFITTATSLANGSTAHAIDVSVLDIEQFKFSDIANNDVIKMQTYVSTKNYIGLLNYILGKDDQITGSSGDDTLSGFAGNDVIDSGLGSDMVLFSGKFSNYAVTHDTTNITVKNILTNETDTLYNTEFLNFDDQMMSFLNPLSPVVTPSTIPPFDLQPVAIVSKKPTSGDDELTGTDKKDTLKGLAGNDTLIGGMNVDKLTGGKGADVFKFNDVQESGITTKTCDTITDFKHNEGDKIDLSAIQLPENKTFTFIGNAKFSADATAQLRFDTKTKMLYASTDADNVPEFSIKLSGVKSLVIDDFIL